MLKIQKYAEKTEEQDSGPEEGGAGGWGVEVSGDFIADSPGFHTPLYSPATPRSPSTARVTSAECL